MKIIYKIAKAELQSLFFSPIAWLILILYTFQTGIDFAGLIDGVMKSKEMGYGATNATSRFFGGWEGVLTIVQGYLYLYIPLLTMNLMSRELGSGSIKLLYSSPVTNVQIILGKYLSMVVYALVLVGILLLYVLVGAFIIKDFDYSQVFTGLLGIYLLICAYAAIGLLMSSLTSYQVVAAVGTLAVLSLLTYVQGWWQDVEFVRDLTYWLAMPGRSQEFLFGMICSANIIYFFLVIALFLAMAIIRLQSRRQKSKWTVTWGKYLGIWAIALLIGYVTSRPAFRSYYDATTTDQNTLTPNSQKIIGQMDGKLKMTTYVNLLDKYFWIGLPARVNEDLKLFEQYVRFKPDMEMEYVYYYDTPSVPAYHEEGNLTMEQQAKKMMKINDLNPKLFLTPEQIKAKIDLSGEHNRVVRELEYNVTAETEEYTVYNDNIKIFKGTTERFNKFVRSSRIVGRLRYVYEQPETLIINFSNQVIGYKYTEGEKLYSILEVEIRRQEELGAFIGELMGKKDTITALKSGIGSLIGFLCGTFLKLVICIYFIVEIFILLKFAMHLKFIQV